MATCTKIKMGKHRSLVNRNRCCDPRIGGLVQHGVLECVVQSWKRPRVGYIALFLLPEPLSRAERVSLRWQGIVMRVDAWRPVSSLYVTSRANVNYECHAVAFFLPRAQASQLTGYESNPEQAELGLATYEYTQGFLCRGVDRHIIQDVQLSCLYLVSSLCLVRQDKHVKTQLVNCEQG